jgi:tetratricopeptide (TPR) repeat protein
MKKILLIFIILFSFCLAKGNKIGINQLKLNLENSVDNLEKIRALNDLGIYYESISSYPNSLEFLYQAQALNTSEKSINEAIITFNYIGYVYWHKSDYDSALFYHNKALNFAETNNVNNENVAFTHLMLGNDYYDKGDFSKASEYYYKSLKIAEDISSNDMLVQNHNRLSKLYLKMKDYPLAYTNVLKSINLNQANNTRELGVSFNSLGNISCSFLF